MKFPIFLYNKDVVVWSTTLGEDGEEEVKLYEGRCVFNEESKQVFNADKQLVTISGSVVIAGDISPNKLINGYVVIDNNRKYILSTTRPKTPKGTVFSTELDLK